MGVPPTRVHVATEPEPMGVNMKSRPQTRTPFDMFVTLDEQPLTLFPMATGAVEMVDRGPNIAWGSCACLRDLIRKTVLDFLPLRLVMRALLIADFPLVILVIKRQPPPASLSPKPPSSGNRIINVTGLTEIG